MVANSRVDTVAYLGPPGTFGEEVALLAAPDAVQIPYPLIRQLQQLLMLVRLTLES